MAKAKTEHVCNACGHRQARWAGQCGGCGEWNTLEEQAAASGANGNGKGVGKAIAKVGSSLAAPAAVKRLSEHSAADFPRFSSGSGELDQVLGGGIVPGSAMVIAAEPGAGKSTLCSSTCDRLAADGKRVLWVAGEESPSQIRLRTDRMGLENSHLIDVATETEVGAICARISAGYDFVVVDSINTVWDAEREGIPGSTAIVKEVAMALVRTAKETGAAVLIVAHVTKEGSMAGPKHMEHMVDVVLDLAGERTQAFRVLRSIKNRFGSTNEVGVFEMTAKGLEEVTDPTAAFLQEHDERVSGSVICPVAEGTRPMLIEVQALTDPAPHERPAMRRVQGVDRNRLDMLLAVLNRHSGLLLKTGQQDVYVKLSGGLRVDEPALDLALCVAIASDVTGRPVKQGVAIFGEVSLKGDVRPVAQAERRLAEATKLGWPAVIGGPKQGKTSVTSLKQALDAALEPAS